MKKLLAFLFSWCDVRIMRSVRPVDTGLEKWLAEPWKEGRIWNAPPVTFTQKLNRRKMIWAAWFRALAVKYRK